MVEPIAKWPPAPPPPPHMTSTVPTFTQQARAEVMSYTVPTLPVMVATARISEEAAAMLRENFARGLQSPNEGRLRIVENDVTRVVQAPIPMVLHCPKCGRQHIDEPNFDKGWTNPPHKSHLCVACGTIWRPADVPTTGVAAVRTRGSADTWPK